MIRVSVHEHVVSDSASGLCDVTTGPDSALWFTMIHSGRIGRLVPGAEPASRQLDSSCGPAVLVTGPDGALWFTEYQAHRIGRITTGNVLDEWTHLNLYASSSST